MKNYKIDKQVKKLQTEKQNGLIKKQKSVKSEKLYFLTENHKFDLLD